MDDLIFDNNDNEKFQIIHDVDLNSLFNFTYNFDLLKGIIGNLLKNQQVLQRQIVFGNIEKKDKDKEIESLRNEIKTMKEKFTTKEDLMNIQYQLNKINEVYQVLDEQTKKGK